jgi:predicted SAM-dependent methyltransferase
MTFKQEIGRFLSTRIPLNPKVVSIIRFEIAAARARAASRILPLRIAKINKFRASRGLKINLGSRDAFESWIPLDVRMQCKQGLSWDIRRGLPFADGSVTLIYASHVFEHIDFKFDLPKLLNACRVALSASGKIRIVVPDTALFIDAYLSSDGKKWASLGFKSMPVDMPTPMCLVNHVFHQDGEHQFGYDYETLKWALENAGFEDIGISTFRGSTHFPASLDLACHEPYSLYVEASKR